MVGQETGPVNDTDVPASVTVLLFGDTFAPAVPAGSKGTVAYATGVTVETEILVQKMIMLDLIHLQNTGAIAVEPFLRKIVLRLGMARVNIRVTDEEELRSSPGRIARAIAADKNARQDGKNVRAVIAEAFPKSEHPYQMMVQLGLDDAVELGYLWLERDPGWRGIARALAGRATMVPRMERVQALRPAAEALAAEWTRFNETNADAADQLWQFVEDGIANRKEHGAGGYP
jgi:hypothetical protein